MSRIQPAIFSTLGVFSIAQELSGLVASVMDAADAELIAEESLCLVSVATARAVEASAPTERDLAESLLVTPFLYRDYLVGSTMIDADDSGQAQNGSVVGERLEKKAAFYAVHLPAATLPIGQILYNAMLLWMGRVSRPGMKTSPHERLVETDSLRKLESHVRLIAAYVRHASGG